VHCSNSKCYAKNTAGSSKVVYKRMIDIMTRFLNDRKRWAVPPCPLSLIQTSY